MVGSTPGMKTKHPFGKAIATVVKILLLLYYEWIIGVPVNCNYEILKLKSFSCSTLNADSTLILLLDKKIEHFGDQMSIL